jgi:hypothetical protein
MQDPCKDEPFVVGNCEAAISRWSFNPETKQCEEFSYGGCDGNGNNFESQKDCEIKCDVKPTDCCPPGEFCCGNSCLEDGTQTFAPCGPNQCKTKTCKPPPEECICTQEFNPVCSERTGKTYGNACLAKCAKDDCCLIPGECKDPKPCICSKEYMPLCNKKKNITYGNKCQAVKCAGEKEEDLVKGTCEGVKKPCVCTTEFAPVCSKKTNITYGNKCEAVQCAGEKEEDLFAGECKDPGNFPPDPCCPKKGTCCCGDSCIPCEDLAARTCTKSSCCKEKPY